MDSATIQRYQLGGDIYTTLTSEYGAAAANAVAQAALTGDVTQVNDALASAKGDGGVQDTSTLDALASQLTTDPLGAPLATLDSALSTAFGDLFENPAVLIGLALVIFFFVFNGVAILRKIK